MGLFSVSVVVMSDVPHDRAAAAEQGQQSGPPAEHRTEPVSVKPAAADPLTVEDLPPVQPPSAGFIVQLFVVPAIIVMVVVGVWALFGRMAAGEQDWRSLIPEIRSSNPHRRWRAANGLAQMLDVDLKRGESGKKLTDNREIAAALSSLLDEELQSRSQRLDDLKQRAFLVRTLGLLDVFDVTVPVLQKAMTAENDREIRKNAIAAVAVLAHRTTQQDAADGTSRMSGLAAMPSLVDDLIQTSRDEDVLIRETGTYTLALFPTTAAGRQLTLLLSDVDRNTRINAALGLARRKSTAGVPLFRSILTEALQPSGSKERPIEGFDLVVLKNVLKAVGDLSPRMTGEQRQDLRTLIVPIAAEHTHVRIRLDAEQALHRLK